MTTAVGYTQGKKEEPTYQEVCSGTTGHTEAVQVRFDPAVVTYNRLCDLFWERLGDNRYLLNQVGNDRGTQCERDLSEIQTATLLPPVDARLECTPSRVEQTGTASTRTRRRRQTWRRRPSRSWSWRLPARRYTRK